MRDSGSKISRDCEISRDLARSREIESQALKVENMYTFECRKHLENFDVPIKYLHISKIWGDIKTLTILFPFLFVIFG